MKRLLVITIIFLALFIHPAQAVAATLSLSPSTGTYNRGCNFALNIDLDTQGVQTDGTDVILFYDPTRVIAQSITSGTIYPDYPGNNIDASAGKITVTGLASVETAFSGRGTLATINLTVQANAPTGATQIRFDFDPNNKAKTTDSNVVQRTPIVDVLNSVVDGSYTIGTGSCGAVGPTPTPGYSYGQQTGGASSYGATPSSYLPPAGSEQFTFTLAIFGLTLTVLGILGIALL